MLGLSISGIEDPPIVLGPAADALTLRANGRLVDRTVSRTFLASPTAGSEAILSFDASNLRLSEVEEVGISLTLPLQPRRGSPETVDPLTFEFTLPVTPVPAIRITPIVVVESVVASGVEITVHRIEFSPPRSVMVDIDVPPEFFAHDGIEDYFGHEAPSFAILESPSGITAGAQLALSEDRRRLHRLRFDMYAPEFEGRWQLMVHRLMPDAQLNAVGWTDQDQAGGPWVLAIDVEGPGTAPAEVQRVRSVYDLLAELGEPEREVALANHWLDITSDVLNVYLREGDPGAVEAAIRTVFGERVPSGGIRVVGPGDVEAAMASWWAGEPAEGKRPGEYDNSEIETARSYDGIQTYSAASNADDPIHYMVESEWVAHRIREAYAVSSIPQEALTIDISPKGLLDGWTAQTLASNGIRLSLSIPKTVRLGDEATLEAVLTNERDVSVTFEHGIRLENLVVFAEAGEQQMWTKHRGGVQRSIGLSTTIGSGEQTRLATRWSLTDQDGFLMPPGRYQVVASVSMESMSSPFRKEMLTTEPQWLEALP